MSFRQLFSAIAVDEDDLELLGNNKLSYFVKLVKMFVPKPFAVGNQVNFQGCKKMKLIGL